MYGCKCANSFISKVLSYYLGKVIRKPHFVACEKQVQTSLHIILISAFVFHLQIKNNLECKNCEYFLFHRVFLDAQNPVFWRISIKMTPKKSISASSMMQFPPPPPPPPPKKKTTKNKTSLSLGSSKVKLYFQNISQFPVANFSWFYQ